MNTFSGLVVEDTGDNVTAAIHKLSLNQLSEGNIVIETAYSSVNFKDALASKKNGGVIRQYPMIPGIDLSGKVLSSEDPRYQPGQQVIVTGFGLGVSHTGGFAKIARVPADWIVPLPKKLTLRDAMIFGTAGFTAALCIDALETNGLANNKEARIVITGASGGVGSLAIAMLKKLGYHNIIAVSQKQEAVDTLKQLGAREVVNLKELLPEKIKALEKQTIDFAIDTVGGAVTAALLPQISYDGSIAICGNAAGLKVETTVLPFILRGVKLLGIDSVNVEMEKRKRLWQRLAGDLNVADHSIVTEASLAELPETFASLQQGSHIGRTIIKMT